MPATLEDDVQPVLVVLGELALREEVPSVLAAHRQRTRSDVLGAPGIHVDEQDTRVVVQRVAVKPQLAPVRHGFATTRQISPTAP